nr:MAG: ribosome-associated translation inhibitor RaiA [bacterium]
MTSRAGSTRQRPRTPGGRMIINISARHCRVADSIRRRAEDRLRKMVRFEPRIDSADVVFEHDHGFYAVEVRAFVTGRSTVVAHAAAADARAALDQVLSRLGTRLRRQHDRSREHSVGTPKSEDSFQKGIVAR